MLTGWPKSSEGTYITVKDVKDTPTYLRPRPEYPHRYYAGLLKEDDTQYAGYENQIALWLDAWRISSVENFPPANELIPMTIEQWDYHNAEDDHGLMLHLRAQYIDGEFQDIPL